MIQGNDTRVIDVVHPVCCGLDVHKDSVSACLLFHDAGGCERSEVKEFGTYTDELIRLREWLQGHDCPVVAMESTGVYWRPVHNILEDHIRVILVNPRDIKNLPGRKTDISDSKWIAGLLKHGLLRGSFIAPKEVRQWRDLTRLRRRYVQTAADYRRRVQKLFESANIKIDSVVTDLFGASGRLKRSDVEIFRAIQGFFKDHHRFQLRSLLKTVHHLEGEIAHLDAQIKLLTAEQENILERLKEIPGIAEIASRDILAEIGPTLGFSIVCIPGSLVRSVPRQQSKCRKKNEWKKSCF
jgi:transposase